MKSESIRINELRVAAIICAFNEEDIISDTIASLIDGGLDVYLLDDRSTDNTVLNSARHFGRGLRGIIQINLDQQRKEYSQRRNLMAVQRFALHLDYDWFVYVDADEIRLGPWESKNLRDSIAVVDEAGYDLINFKVYNFRPTQDNGGHDSFESSMSYYESAGNFDLRQIKAWKRDDRIDFSTHAGHYPTTEATKRLYPTRFILKHYPIRSKAHFKKKVIEERAKLFSKDELAIGWHIQYNQLLKDSEFEIWSKEGLVRFEVSYERKDLLQEALVCQRLTFLAHDGQFTPELSFRKNTLQVLALLLPSLQINSTKFVDHVNKAVSTRNQLLSFSELPPEILHHDTIQNKCLYTLAAIDYLEGRPHLITALRSLHSGSHWLRMQEIADGFRM